MRIVALVGSTRRGNTYAMVESACHALNSESDVEFIHLKDSVINLCDGCLKCDETGECHINDSMTEIIKSIEAADGLIIGTPARWSLLSGELKILFDRLNPLAAPEGLKGKKAIVFTVGQSKPDQDNSVERAAKSVTYFCENAGIEVIDIVLAYGCLEPSDLIENNPGVLSVCKSSARRLLESLNA